MSPGTVPCRACRAAIPIEQARCGRCGTPVPGGALADLPTVPGQPLVRAPRPRRASTFDYVPPALANELARRQHASATQDALAAKGRRQKLAFATAIGAALNALPFFAANVVFLPDRRLAVPGLAAHGLLGALCGRLLDHRGGGLGKAVLLFVPSFAISGALEVELGYPIAHTPAAAAVLGLAAVLALLVAGFLGVALDEHA